MLVDKNLDLIILRRDPTCGSIFGVIKAKQWLPHCLKQYIPLYLKHKIDEKESTKWQQKLKTGNNKRYLLRALPYLIPQRGPNLVFINNKKNSYKYISYSKYVLNSFHWIIFVMPVNFCFICLNWFYCRLYIFTYPVKHVCRGQHDNVWKC